SKRDWSSDVCSSDLGREQAVKKRVVITGMGAVTPLGHDIHTTWESMKRGVSAVGHSDRIDPEKVDVTLAAEVKDFKPEDFMEKKESRRMGRFSQFAIAASKMAAEDAKLKIGENADSNRVGVWIGSGIGGLAEFEEQHKRFL